MVLINLAIVYGGLQEWDLALKTAKRGLSIDERCYGQNHLEVARDLLSLGSLTLAQGDYAEAESYMRRCIDLRQHQLGPNNAEVLAAQDILCQSLVEQGKHEEASTLLKGLIAAAEQLMKSAQRDDVPSGLVNLYARRAHSLEALGRTKAACGDLIAALAALKRANLTDAPQSKQLSQWLARLRAEQRTRTTASPKPRLKAKPAGKPRSKAK